MQKEYNKNDFEKKKLQMEADSVRKNQSTHIKDKFDGSSKDIEEEEFKKYTVGLKTKEEFRSIRENTTDKVKEDTKKRLEEELELKRRQCQERKENYKKRHKQLTFDLDENADEGKEKSSENKEKSEVTDEIDNVGDTIVKKRNLGKNPLVDTSFLPDKERDETNRKEREMFKEAYFKEQDLIKNELLEIEYNYWDGTNITRKVRIKKDTKVLEFLQKVRNVLAGEYFEFKKVSADGLVLVINDLILPNSITFYEIIRQGISCKGRLVFDLEKAEESVNGKQVEFFRNKAKPGKVIEKRVFEKSRHIFPCSTWEQLDSSKYIIE